MAKTIDIQVQESEKELESIIRKSKSNLIQSRNELNEYGNKKLKLYIISKLDTPTAWTIKPTGYNIGANGIDYSKERIEKNKNRFEDDLKQYEFEEKINRIIINRNLE